MPTSRFRSSLGLLTHSLIPTLNTRFMALLGRSQPTPAALVETTETIRKLMLRELGDHGEKKFPAVARRVRNAPDVLGLWYARSDVMAILANAHGEKVAREKVIHISSKFKGLIPHSLTNRTGLRAR